MKVEHDLVDFVFYKQSRNSVIVDNNVLGNHHVLVFPNIFLKSLRSLKRHKLSLHQIKHLVSNLNLIFLTVARNLVYLYILQSSLQTVYFLLIFFIYKGN